MHKFSSLLFSVGMGLASAAMAAGAGAADHGDGHGHAPRHGGIVVETRQMDHELVAGPTAIKLYLSDHGKALDLSKARAKLTLLSGAEKRDVELIPAGDRLEATGNFVIAPGAKAVVVVTGAGKTPSTARFVLK